MRTAKKHISVIFIATLFSLLIILGIASSKRAFAQNQISFESGKVSECEYEITNVGKKQRKELGNNIKKISVLKYDDNHTYLIIDHSFSVINLFLREKDKKTQEIKVEHKFRYEDDAYVVKEDWLKKPISVEVQVAKKKKYKGYSFGIKIKNIKKTSDITEDKQRNPVEIPQFKEDIPDEITTNKGKFYIPKNKASLKGEESLVAILIEEKDQIAKDVTRDTTYNATKDFTIKYIAKSTKYKRTDGSEAKVTKTTKVRVTNSGLASSKEVKIQAYKHTQGKELEPIKKKFKTYEKAIYLAYKVEAFDSEGKSKKVTAKEVSLEVPKQFNIKKTNVYVLRNNKLEKIKKTQIKGNRLSVFNVSDVEHIYLVQKGMPRWGAPIISTAVMIIIATAIVVSAVVRNKKKEMEDLEEEEKENDR